MQENNNETPNKSEGFLGNWDKNRKNSLYQLIFFAVFFVLLIGMLATDSNENKNEINDGNSVQQGNQEQTPGEMKEKLHESIIENYSFAFTLDVTSQDINEHYEGKSYQNKILATNQDNETYYIENGTTYLLNETSGVYNLVNSNVYLVEFRYEILKDVIAECSFESESKTEEGTKREYHYETNKITTLETEDTLTITIENNGNIVTIKYYDINKVEDFTVQ